MKRIEIFWTPLARQSLQETVDFLTNIWNEEGVDNFFELVDQKIEIIQDHPNIGFKIKKSEIRRILVHPNISLFYIFRNYSGCNLINPESAFFFLTCLCAGCDSVLFSVLEKQVLG